MFGILLILAQVFLFRNYLPFLTQKIVVKGIKCTCPDAVVLSGKDYLRAITPDSLKKYDLNYDEIYFENGISTISDPMGVHQYIITGEVIGKSSISEGDEHYYPLFKIADYNEVFIYNIVKWLIRGLLLVELIVLFAIHTRKRNEV